MEAAEDFKTISKYTPAKPEVQQPSTTDNSPHILFSFPEPESVWDSCTNATPTANATIDDHCPEVSLRLSMSTENTAVVMIFI